MAKEKFKLVTYVMPDGVAEMAFLNAPSTKYKAEGEFSTRVVYDPEAIQKHVETWDKLIEEKFAETLKENPKLKKVLKKVSPVKPQLDDDGDETGKVTITFKRIHKQAIKSGPKAGTTKINTVKLIDSAGNTMNDEIWSGSTLAIKYFATPYYMEKDKEVGISLKLHTVMVVDLVSAGGDDGNVDVEKAGFGKRDGGYKAGASKPAHDDDEGDDADTSSGDDADDDDGSAF